MSRLFDATTEQISLSSAINLGSNRTACAWVRPTSADSTRRWALTVGAGSDYNLFLGFDDAATNNIETGFEETLGGFETVTFTSGWAAGSWHWFCQTYDGTTLRLFTKDLGADVIERATLSTSTTPVTPGSPVMLIGQIQDGSAEDWDGRIAHVFFFDTTLTIGQLRNVANYGRTDQAPVAFLPLFGASSPEPDYSGNGRNGTITGATLADHVPAPPLFGFDVAAPYRVVTGRIMSSLVGAGGLAGTGGIGGQGGGLAS